MLGLPCMRAKLFWNSCYYDEEPGRIMFIPAMGKAPLLFLRMLGDWLEE
jgi:hypothetical protein